MDTERQRLLAKVESLAASPHEVGKGLLEIVRSTEDAAAAQSSVYDALRSAVWGIIAGRRTTSLGEWYDLLRHVAANAPLVKEKVEVLAELLQQSARFYELHNPRELLRSQQRTIMDVVRARGGIATFEEIARDAPLPTLHRIIYILVARGLLTQRGYGKEAVLSLAAVA
jgi:uncharacterized membrane protein